MFHTILFLLLICCLSIIKSKLNNSKGRKDFVQRKKIIINITFALGTLQLLTYFETKYPAYDKYY